MIPKTAMLIQEFLDQYDAIARWDPLRTERAPKILPMVLEHVEGDILEIGALRGRTTQAFCDVGAKYNRHVFVVDPWDGRQQGSHKEFTEFQNNTAGCQNLTVHRMASENPAALKALKEQGVKLSFILIDGLHTYDAVHNDLMLYKDLLESHGVICIDDWRGPYGFSAAIQKAAHEQLDEDYQHLKTPDSFIETYFVKL
jgi:hypothetical protein